MPFTPNINLERPAHGDYPDTWEMPVNYNWDIVDALFAATGLYDLVPGTGHAHDGTAGQGPKIRHQDLVGSGVSSHAALDSAINRTKVSVADTTVDYLASKIVAGPSGTVLLTILNPGANEQLEVEVVGATAVFGDINDPSGEYGWKHFVPTSAPVAYTDNFNYPSQTPLNNCDYVVKSLSGTYPFYTTGYSAVAYIDPAGGSVLIDSYAATVACHIPHGRAQRATLSISSFDYSNLYAGDSVSFTLAVHSTATNGAMLPHQVGVVLEINLTKVLDAPATYKMTHRIFILPDAATRVQIFECHVHANPDDIEGCWELSLDANGHVYHYWRQQLVFSSQSVPPNIPGPVAAYFAAMTASLALLSEPKYGAIGFGLQYAIGMFSKFDMEIRWFSATANADVYDVVPPACPGVGFPYGVPVTVTLPEEYFFAIPGGLPGGIPGAQCCLAPAVNVGDVLAYDAGGNPEVWVTGCNEIPTDVDPNAKGFSTNMSWDVCFPCDAPSGTPVFFNPPIGWPMEATTGAIIVHGIEPLPPFMQITSSTPGFEIVDAVRLNWTEFLLKYNILDGYSGTPVDLTIANGYVPAISFLVSPFVTITNHPPEVVSITWLDTYSGLLTSPTDGYEFDATFTGKGFDVGCVLSTGTPNVTVVSYSRVSDSQIDAVIKFDFECGPSAVFDVVNLDAQADAVTVTVAYTAPVVYYPMLTATSGANQTGTIFGNFFSAAVVVAPDPASLPNVANFSFARVDQYSITYQLDFVGVGGSLIGFDISDAARSVSTNMPLCFISDAAIPTITLPITLLPDTVLNGGATKPYKVTVPGVNHGITAWIRINNYTPGEVYNSPGDIHTTGHPGAATEGTFRVWCAEGPMNIDITIEKPGVGSALAIAAFPTAPPLSLVLVPGSLVWSAGLEPGATGTLTITPAANVCHLTEVSDVSPAVIALTNRVYNSGPGTVTYDYTVATDAVEGAIVALLLQNGPCDAGPVPSNVTIENLPPVITSIYQNVQENVNPAEGYIYGENFDPLCVIAVLGNMAYSGHTWISSTKIALATANGPFPGPATVMVTNPDLKSSAAFPLNVAAEIAPDVDHAEAVPAVTGVIGAKLYVYGSNLNPPGAVYTFVGFNVTSTDRTLGGYLEFTGDIVAAAGNWITADIASLANPGGYGPTNLVLVEATAGGAVLVHAIGTPTAKDNQLGVTMVIDGENLDLITLVEADAAVPARQATKYIPSGVISPIDVTIMSSAPSRLVLNLDIKKGLAFNFYNMLLYGVGPVLLATAPSALKTLPSDNAPVIAEADRTILDAAIPAGAGLPWSVSIPVGTGVLPWMFGDLIVAEGWTIQPGTVYVPGTQSWTVNGLNSAIVGTKWALTISRPGMPGTEECCYRIPGGVII